MSDDKEPKSDITVDKEKFDKLLRHMIESKPVTFKDVVKTSKKRKVKPKGSLSREYLKRIYTV